MPIILNIAGNRESKNPGIGALAEEFLIKVFAAVLAEPAQEPSQDGRRA